MYKKLSKMKLYIRLAKTGSSSLSKVLPKGIDELTPAPQNMVVYEKNKSRYTSSFTIIRNPYDRFVSAYHNAISGPGHKRIIRVLKDRINTNTTFEEFISIVLEFRKNYKKLNISKTGNIHTIPWYDKSRKPEENRLSYEAYWILSHTESLTDSIEYYIPIENLDFIGRFETLNEDYNELKKIIGTSVNLPHINKSNRDVGYKQYYNNKTLKLVSEMYQKDLNNFGYTF
jgi:hypothetical protein